MKWLSLTFMTIFLCSQGLHGQNQSVSPSEEADDTIQFWERSFRVSDAQKKAYRTLVARHQKAYQDARSPIEPKGVELSQALYSANKVGDQVTFEKLKSELDALGKPLQKLAVQQAMEKSNFLTREQLERINENMPRIFVEDNTAPVKLSRENFARVMACYAETKKTKGSIVAFEKLPEATLSVLTASQKTEIVTAHANKYAGGLLERVDATPSQREQAKAIVANVVKGFNFDKAWPDFSSLADTLHPQLKEIFTAEQKVTAGNLISITAKLLPEDVKKEK